MSTANLIQRRRIAEARSIISALQSELNEMQVLSAQITEAEFQTFSALHEGIKKLNEAFATRVDSLSAGA